MATQSLYRRYRPRRFSEVKGQEHVVRALRNAVINHREGQAYLFSGPRGTGKTTSARILAKVLNCERPVDGEPCCECDSCLAVERGTSFDVHELDAASNNGVDAMRDLIEKASLGTPGRHKVYILDEVHMLSRAAEAALLKTLEEPPAHVVFVLATTDPQKVSETIRSRTQHLQFHLLAMDVLDEYVRWLAKDAGIELDDAALQAVLRQGGGSARDTLSALELFASSGGDVVEATPLDEFVEAMIEHDPGRALALVAHSVQQGREARLLADDIIRHLRDCFLSLMAPELVQLPAARQDEVSALATRLGAAAIVRAMERIGEMLVEMRYAPDPRLLLEVALVQLTHVAAQTEPSVILDRLERLEHAVEHLDQAASAGVRAPVAPAPTDPVTGRAELGGRVPRGGSDHTPAAGEQRPTTTTATRGQRAATPADVALPPTQPETGEDPLPADSGGSARPGAPVGGGESGDVAARGSAASSAVIGAVVARWGEVVPVLRGIARPLFSAMTVVGERDGKLVVGAPNEAHRVRSSAHVAELEAAIAKLIGASVPVVLIVDGSDPEGLLDAGAPGAGPLGGGTVVALRAKGQSTASAARGDEPHPPGLEPGIGADADDAGGGGPTAPHDLDDVGGIDFSELTDVPPESVLGPVDRLLQAFPGSQEMDER